MMGIKHTLEDVKKYISDNGCEFLSEAYKDVKSKILVKFQCGHVRETTFSNFKQGRRCFTCSRSHSLEYVRNYILENGCELLSNEYNGNQSKLSIRFECGHIGNISFNNFLRGERCKNCSHKNAYYKNRISKNEVIKILIDNDLKLVEFPDGYTKQKLVFVIYSCEEGHITKRKLSDFLRYPTCKKCSRENFVLLHSGENSANWQNGKTNLSRFIRQLLTQWKNDSMKSCNYKCVITGERFDEIHHLYSFSKIVNDAMQELGLLKNKNRGDYSKREIELLENKIKEIHDNYPLGVCLRKDVHILFHKIYGKINNTPEQFRDFESKINNEKIILKGG
jgi:hypothetical protein